MGARSFGRRSISECLIALLLLLPLSPALAQNDLGPQITVDSVPSGACVVEGMTFKVVNTGTTGGEEYCCEGLTWVKCPTADTSAELAGELSDETGTGLAVFNNDAVCDSTFTVRDQDTNPTFEVYDGGQVCVNEASPIGALNVYGDSWSPVQDPELEFWFRVDDLVVSCSTDGVSFGEISETWNDVTGNYTATGGGISSSDCTTPSGEKPSHTCGHCCEWNLFASCENIYDPAGCACTDWVSSKESASGVTSHVETWRCMSGRKGGEYFDLSPDYALDTVDDSFTVIGVVRDAEIDVALDTSGYMLADQVDGTATGSGDTLKIFRDNNVAASPAKWRVGSTAPGNDYTNNLKGSETTGSCSDSEVGEGPDAFGVLTVQVEKTDTQEFTLNIARLNGANVRKASPPSFQGVSDGSFDVDYILGWGVKSLALLLFHTEGGTMPLDRIKQVENYLATHYGLGAGIADNTGSMEPGPLGVFGNPGLIVESKGGNQLELRADADSVCTFYVSTDTTLTIGDAGCDVVFEGQVTAPGSHPTTSQGVADVVTDETGTGDMVFANDATMENLTVQEDGGLPLVVTRDDTNDTIVRLVYPFPSAEPLLLELHADSATAGQKGGAIGVAADRENGTFDRIGKMIMHTEQSWTETASTRDSLFELQLSEDDVMRYPFRVYGTDGLVELATGNVDSNNTGVGFSFDALSATSDIFQMRKAGVLLFGLDNDGDLNLVSGAYKTTTGIFNSSVNDTGEAFRFNATGASHTGTLAEWQDEGVDAMVLGQGSAHRLRVNSETDDQVIQSWYDVEGNLAAYIYDRAGAQGGALYLRDGSANADVRLDAAASHSWLNSEGGLTVGATTGPTAEIDVLALSGAQLRLEQDDDVDFCDFTVDSGGDLVLTCSGDTVTFEQAGGEGLLATVGTDTSVTFESTEEPSKWAFRNSSTGDGEGFTIDIETDGDIVFDTTVAIPTESGKFEWDSAMIINDKTGECGNKWNIATFAHDAAAGEVDDRELTCVEHADDPPGTGSYMYWNPPQEALVVSNIITGSGFSADIVTGTDEVIAGNALKMSYVDCNGEPICQDGGSGITCCNSSFESAQGGSNPAWTMDADQGTHTGDLLEVSDEGTWKFRVNTAGNVQLFDGGRLFIADGADESSYGGAWGDVVLVQNETGVLSGTESRGVRTRYSFSGSATSSAARRGNWFNIRFTPTGNNVTSTYLTGAYYEVNDESSGTGHQIVEMNAQENFLQALGTGTTAILAMNGSVNRLSFAGSNKTITQARGQWLRSPIGPGASTTVANNVALDIDDWGGHGTYDAVVRIADQGGADGDKGNVDWLVGDFDGGHLQMNNCHLWNDQTEDWRVKCGSKPTTQTDGVRLIKDYWSGYDTTGGTSINTAATVTIDTVYKSSSGSVFTLSSNQLTVAKTGTFLVTFDCGTDNPTAGNRTESDCYLEINTGISFAEITGSRCSIYNRNSAQGEGSCSSTLIRDINSGDILRLRAVRESGTDSLVTLADESRLTLTEL